jgi:hypothetical protein
LLKEKGAVAVIRVLLRRRSVRARELRWQDGPNLKEGTEKNLLLRRRRSQLAAGPARRSVVKGWMSVGKSGATRASPYLRFSTDSAASCP